MAEEAKEKIMVQDATPKKKAFISKPYSQEERLKRDEEELAQLLKEQKGEAEKPDTEEKKEDEAEPTNAEEKTFKKRYGDLRRHTQEKEKQFQKQLDDLKSQLDKATKKEIKLPKSESEIEEWSKEYPDVAAIVETIAMKKAKEQSESINKKLKEIDEMNAQNAKDKAEVQLLQMHPDFAEIRDSDDFHQWAEEQPKWVQDALYENSEDARSAARAIDLYKADKNITKSSNVSATKSAATEINTKSSRTKVGVEAGKKVLESTVQKMSAKEYEKKADEIMEAIRSGNFVYDVSGSAR
tara:strand:+ start:10722 stop:11612 length:891 start_codon:yes stop_codon:yes gene_type:complete